MRNELTQEELKELLDYDPETGVFIRKIRTSNRIRQGDVAGGIDANGYRHIRVFGRLYKAHRLAFLWMLGEFPEEDVDHVNGCKDDNRWENLRAVSTRDNCLNQKRHREGRLVGTTYCRRHKKWQAQISDGVRNKYLGMFTMEEEAHAAYLKAKESLESEAK